MRIAQLALGVVLTLLLPTHAGASELELGKGVYQLGGHGTLNLEIDTNIRVWLDLHPTGGVFVGKRTEVVGEVLLTAGSGGAAVAGVAAGLRGVVPQEVFDVYAGGRLGGGRVIGAEGIGWSAIGIGELGAWVPLNKHVAVDLGGRIELYVGEVTFARLPMGYLGVQGFFK